MTDGFADKMFQHCPLLQPLVSPQAIILGLIEHRNVLVYFDRLLVITALGAPHAHEGIQRLPLERQFTSNLPLPVMYRPCLTDCLCLQVPVCGCIMLNDAMDKVLLVKGWVSTQVIRQLLRLNLLLRDCFCSIGNLVFAEQLVELDVPEG